MTEHLLSQRLCKPEYDIHYQPLAFMTEHLLSQRLCKLEYDHTEELALCLLCGHKSDSIDSQFDSNE